MRNKTRVNALNLNAGMVAHLRPWLASRGSLTARLNATCGCPIRVEVLQEGWVRVSALESQLLKLPPRRRVWVRTVKLSCNEETWVWAKTTIPASTLIGKNKQLLKLKSKPLGVWLFAQKDLKRTPMILLKPGKDTHYLWGRASTFVVHSKPLVVCEHFYESCAEMIK